MRSFKKSQIMVLPRSSGAGSQRRKMQKLLYAPSSGWRVASNSLPDASLFASRIALMVRVVFVTHPYVLSLRARLFIHAGALILLVKSLVGTNALVNQRWMN